MTVFAPPVRAVSGQPCPVSGQWRVEGLPHIRAHVVEGVILPDCSGNDVVWRLVRADRQPA